MTTRRQFLSAGAAGAAAILVSRDALAQQPLPPQSKMGIGSASLTNFSRGGGEGPGDPIAMIEHVRRLGAGGLQFSPTGDTAAIRRKLEEYGMFVEGNARLPARLADSTDAFEKSLVDAKAAGATVMRAVSRPPQGSSGRRYESFKSMAEFNAWQDEANAIVLKCLPIAERLKMKIALENHKDRTVDDHVAFLKKTSSEYLGALVDPGNNVSLLEKPEETVGKLAPYAFACSMKDMAVSPYEEGFLLSEVVFGEGSFDQAALFEVMRKHNPKINPVEEVITRDPLKVPCLTPAYQASLPPAYVRRVPAHMAWVKANAKSAPTVSQLDDAGKRAAEDDHHRRTLQWWTRKYGPA